MGGCWPLRRQRYKGNHGAGECKPDPADALQPRFTCADFGIRHLLLSLREGLSGVSLEDLGASEE